MEWIFETLPACINCGSRESAKVFDRFVRGIPLVFEKCAVCGLIFQNPRLTDQSLSDYFSSGTFIKDSSAGDFDPDQILGYPDYCDWEPSYTKTGRLRLAKIAQYSPPPGSFLEIGSATGWFLNVARDMGYAVQGLDVSSSFAQMATSRHNLNIEVGSIEDFHESSAQYDVVCCFGGISCWRDPPQALANIKRALKPRGIFALNRSNVDGLIARVLGHRYFEYNHASLAIYSNTTFNDVLRRAGFKVLYERNEVQYASVERILTYLRMSSASRIARRLGIASLTFPVVAFGTVLTVCVPER